MSSYSDKKRQDILNKIYALEAQLSTMEMEEAQYARELFSSMTQETYAKCEQSLYAYYVHAWEHFDNNPFLGNWHLEAISEHLEAIVNKDIQNLLVNIPPRCSKSSIVNVCFPTWVWGPRRLPHLQFLTASYGQELSTRDSVRSRNLINTEWYQNRWGEIVKLSPDINQKTRYVNTVGGKRIATSIEGIGTGEGFDILIIDDPHKAKDISSKVKRMSVLDWWQGTVSTRANSVDSSKVVIMQRLHEEDLSGHILKEEGLGTWTHLNLPMEYEPTKYVTAIGWQDPRKTKDECLWPERFPPDTLYNLKKQLGEYGVASQLQQTPVPLGGGIIKKSWINHYNEWIPPTAIPRRFPMTVGSWDLTFGDDGDSFVVGQVWGFRDNKYYLLDQVRGKWNIVEQMHQIRNMYSKYPSIKGMLIEKKANGQAVVDLLCREFTNLIAIDPRDLGGGDKVVRVMSVCPLFESGSVYFPSRTINAETQAFVTELEHEIAMFPRGSTDDQVDAMTQALQWLSQRSGGNSKVFTDAFPDRMGDYEPSPFERLYNPKQINLQREMALTDKPMRANEMRSIFNTD